MGILPGNILWQNHNYEPPRERLEHNYCLIRKIEKKKKKIVFQGSNI